MTPANTFNDENLIFFILVKQPTSFGNDIWPTFHTFFGKFEKYIIIEFTYIRFRYLFWA